MTIELITIGSELLAGRTLNTNANFIGDRLAAAGLTLARQVSIPDDHAIIVATIRDSLTRAAWVIVSGGLGPTNDDVTKNAIAKVFDRPLIFHQDLLDLLRKRYAKSGRTITPLLDTQAVLPHGAECIPNELGTAVGIILTKDGRSVVAVPGVPREMQPMIADHIVPRIAAQTNLRTRTITWSTAGWPESRLYESLQSLLTDNTNVAVAFLPSEQGVRLRFSATGPEARKTLNGFTDQARPLIGNALYAEEEISLEVVVGEMLKKRNLTISLAESCTGGLLVKRFTDVPGSSEYVLSGFVTYSNESKTELLGVDSGLIEEHGAVSEAVARAMAEGALVKSGSACAISITGIAGPDGGTPDKPIGTIWIAIAMIDAQTTVKRIQLMGNRAIIRARAAQAALNMLRLRLLDL